MKSSLGIMYFLFTFKLSRCKLDPFITGGSLARYSQYPHSVYLNMNCEDSFICGGSILTQNAILTAAHCMEGCEGVRHQDVQIKYGHEDISQMKTTYLKAYVQHENYDEVQVVNDICLLSPTRSIPLSNKVKRVILMNRPPLAKYAFIAGWGNDEYGRAHKLKHTNAKIQNLNVCSNMGWLPHGTFCAGPITGLGAANAGDSGSALVVNECVQIGIVSFKVGQYSLVAYTNVSYYLKWITKNHQRLNCESR